MGGINIGREGVEIYWDTGDYEGPVRIKATNTDTGDVGTVKDTNDGFHFLTWPAGVWNDHIVVTEAESGKVIDEFDISVKVD